MRKLKLGLIGTGVAARILHWPALMELSDRYELVAVANRTHGKALDFAAMAGLDPSRVYADHRALLARDDLDLVDVLLPPQMNYPVLRDAAARGLDVICEKPIAATLKDARAIMELPARYGVRIFIAENFRYENAIGKAKDRLDQGLIGQPFMISYQYTQPVPPDDEIAGRPWRQDPAHAGGIFTDHGVHMIDALRYLMGDVVTVHAVGRDTRPHCVGFDTAVYSLEFGSGAIGSIQWSFGVASPARWRIEIHGDRGTLGVKCGRVVLRCLGESDRIYVADGPSSFVNEFGDFHDAIVHDRPALISLEDAYRDLETVLAAYRSAAGKGIVFMERKANWT